MIFLHNLFAAVRGPFCSIFWLFGLASVLTMALLVPSRALADEPRSAVISPLEIEARKRFDAGDWEGALLYIERSRAISPSAGNTINAAQCLEKLGRYDEALDLYEIAINRFLPALTEKNRRNIAAVMVEISKRVTVVEISGNIVDAQVAVDGKIRRDISDVRRIRMLPGSHTLRLARNGFVPIDVKVDAGVGGRVHIVVKLKPIGAWIHVEAEGELAVGATVFLDGGIVGSTPWEGAVRGGKHILWAVNGDMGSPPVEVTAAEGDVTPVTLRALKLGVETRIRVTPQSAAIAIDGLVIAQGTWSGRLPIGPHVLDVSEPGYQRRRIDWTVAGSGPPIALAPRMEIDPTHSRWLLRGTYWLGGFVGYALGPSLGSGAEAPCSNGCKGHWGAGGPFVGLRAGYEFSFKLSVEATAGVTRLASNFTRVIQDRFGPENQFQVDYHLDDRITVMGPFVILGVSQRFLLGRDISIIVRFGTGVLVTSSRDPITGRARGGGQDVPVIVYYKDETQLKKMIRRSVDIFVMPELGITSKLGPIELGALLAVGVFLADGPTFERSSIGNDWRFCDAGNPTGAGCAKKSNKVSNELAYGRFVTFIPQLQIRYVFR